ncbi:MAG: hypothetical protein U1F53_03950 [Burkholderiaceae bacterium]
MDGHTLGLIEMGLVFGLVIGWGWWELRSLRRARERAQQQAEASRDPPA